MKNIYNVVRQAVELFHDVHLGLRASNVGAGADERTCSTFCLIAWSHPWCSWGWLTQQRSHQHVTDVGIMFEWYVISNSMTVINYGSELVGKKVLESVVVLTAMIG